MDKEKYSGCPFHQGAKKLKNAIPQMLGLDDYNKINLKNFIGALSQYNAYAEDLVDDFIPNFYEYSEEDQSKIIQSALVAYLLSNTDLMNRISKLTKKFPGQNQKILSLQGLDSQQKNLFKKKLRSDFLNEIKGWAEDIHKTGEIVYQRYQELATILDEDFKKLLATPAFSVSKSSQDELKLYHSPKVLIGRGMGTAFNFTLGILFEIPNLFYKAHNRPINKDEYLDAANKNIKKISNNLAAYNLFALSSLSRTLNESSDVLTNFSDDFFTLSDKNQIQLKASIEKDFIHSVEKEADEMYNNIFQNIDPGVPKKESLIIEKKCPALLAGVLSDFYTDVSNMCVELFFPTENSDDDVVIKEKS